MDNFNKQYWISFVKQKVGKLSILQFEELARLKFIHSEVCKYSTKVNDFITIKIPFDINNIMYMAQNIHKTNSQSKFYNTDQRIKLVHDFCENIGISIYGNLWKIKSINRKILEQSLFEIKAAIYTNLASKKIKKYNKFSVDYILMKLKYSLVKYILNPGVNVGVLSATCTSSGATQFTLDSFHTSGTSKTIQQSTSNIKKIRKLIISQKDYNLFSFSKIYINPKYTNISEISKMVKEIEHIKFHQIIKKISIIFDRNFFNGKTIFKKDQKFVSYLKNETNRFKLRINKRLSTTSIRIKFSEENMFKYNININYISAQLLKEFKDIYVFITGKTTCRIYVLKSIFDEIKELKKKINVFSRTFSIKGIDNIISATLSDTPEDKLRYDDINHENIKEKRYYCETYGTNLRKILKLDFVDKINSISNYPNEINELFGIDAAAEMLIREIFNTFKDNGINDININYIKTLVDFMTSTGKIIPLKFSGFIKSDMIEPYQQLSHERFLLFLKHNALYTKKDNLTSPSGSLMVSQPGLYGSGMFDLTISSKRSKNSKSK